MNSTFHPTLQLLEPTAKYTFSLSHSILLQPLLRRLLTVFSAEGIIPYMTEAEIWRVVYLSRFHDIGKQALPIGILKKHGKPTLEEQRLLQMHPVLAAQILRSIPYLRDYGYYDILYDICLHHHERWDGGGYPDGLKARHITPYVHVVGLTDAYDELRTARPYKRAFTHEEAISMLCGGECGAFDPNMIDCLQELPEAVFSACYGKERKIG